MDKGLFAKHIRSLERRVESKQEVINTIFTETGVLVEDSEIVLEKKSISIHTTSVKRSALLRKKYKEVLRRLGYTLRN